MASIVIHMAVAKEVNNKLKRNENEVLLGTIAPDISKLLGVNKNISHFITDRENIPELDIFLNKYKKYLNEDFVLGYYIHLYTDYLWFNYFIPEIYDKDIITKLDGSKVKCTGHMHDLYIYNDYTNLNHILIKKYGLSIDILKNIDNISNPINEIDTSKMPLLIDKTKDIMKNATIDKEYVFTGDHIERFINFSTKLILSNIKDIL